MADPANFDTDAQSVTSPFNTEEILRACPALLAKWKQRPFILDVDQHGSVIVSYLVTPPNVKGN